MSSVARERIKEHLLSSGLAPSPGFEIPMRDVRVDAALFRQENLELLTEEQKLVNA